MTFETLTKHREAIRSRLSVMPADSREIARWIGETENNAIFVLTTMADVGRVYHTDASGHSCKLYGMGGER